MATLDLRGAKSAVLIADPNLIKFGSLTGTPTATAWSYLTPAGNRVTLSGSGIQFDASGRPIAGTATAITVDVANDGITDLVLTGISIGASPLGSVLASSSSDVWRMLLSGNDVILGPENADGLTNGGSDVFGDGLAARAGESTGGQDVIQLGDGRAFGLGDVENVGSGLVGSLSSTFHGGNDELLGLVTDELQSASGDASRVYRSSTLVGGHDVILVQSLHRDAYATGDTGDASGKVLGGDDYITAGKDFLGRLIGDVDEAHPGSTVTGGKDTLNGGDMGEILVGDVYKLRAGRLDGGNDTINAGGGNDIIAGDAWEVRSDSIGSGGDDVIHGGGSNDEIYGDFSTGGTNVVGGDDRLYGDGGNDRVSGEGGDDTVDGGDGVDRLYGGNGDDWLSGGAGDDTLYGDAGNDMLDGGAGADALSGLAGDDTYFVNNTGDTVSEMAGPGIDTVWSFLNAATLSANVENLRFNGIGDFVGTGNGLANVIAGSAGSDRLDGGSGRDVLIGSAGGDVLIGDTGGDVFDFDTAEDSMSGARDVIRAGTVAAFQGAGVAGGDLIDLSGIDANSGAAGDQDFLFGGIGAGRVSVTASGTNSLVRANLDNDAAFEFELLIEDGGVLPSAYEALDFIL